MAWKQAVPVFKRKSKEPSFSKFSQIYIYYWPSIKSRWLDIGQVLFLPFYAGPRQNTRSTKMQKENKVNIQLYYMASCASGQYAANSVFWLATRAGKMERYCPPGIARFVPANKISPKFKRVHESFLSQNIFRDNEKVFCDLFVRMELENEKTERRYHFCI